MTTQKKYGLPSAQQEDIEEALGIIWDKFEEGIYDKKNILQFLEERVSKEVYLDLLNQNIVVEEQNNVIFTQEGEHLAKDLVRRHRLAERLLMDVLSISSNALDPNACKLEHIISPEVAQSICTLLGHPRECPHGSPIPKGVCCEQTAESVEPIISSLDKLEPGSGGKIVYLLLQNHPDLHKLLALGLVPGTSFNLHQTFPTYVIEVGETTLALEKEIAEKIYVRRAA